MDPVALSHTFLRKLRHTNNPRMGPGDSVGFQLGANGTMHHIKPVAHKADLVYDIGMFTTGMLRYLELVAATPELSSRLFDILRWFRLLIEMKATDHSRVKFAKEFMWKYQGSDRAVDWEGKLESDYALQRDFLVAPSEARDMRRTPQGGGSAARAGSNGRGRRREESPSGQGGRPDAKRPRVSRMRLCRSRSDPAKGECSFPSCKYSHECASCGQDHSAKACQTAGLWSTAMAARITALHNQN